MSTERNFTGEHLHTLDDKSRVSFPLRLRDAMRGEELQAGFFITKGHEGALLIYPRDEWQVVAERVKGLPATRAEERGYQRMFLGKAHPLYLDKQNRLLLPEALCKAAGIEKDVVFVGVGRHIELWGKDRFDEYEKSIASAYDRFAELVFPRSEGAGAPAAGKG